MLAKLKRLIAEGIGGPEAAGAPRLDDTKLAAAVLMVEAATMDQEFDEDERAKIRSLLSTHFDLRGDEADQLIAEASRRADGSVELYRMTRDIKNVYDEGERIKLLEMLWEITYTDGELHDMEASFMRRLAGLLYITDHENGKARRRARERLGLPGP